MEIFETIAATRMKIRELRSKGRTIGLIPTMGALHQGHLELVKLSLDKMEVTIVSLFVNPRQFNNSNDLLNYPRNAEKDIELLKAMGVDFLFMPGEEEVYPKPVVLNFNFGTMEEILEGSFRPGHFNGVALVVAKLFNIIQPDMAFFGQKDLQQVAIIKQLVEDLSLSITLCILPTLREGNGLALSSRNERLSLEGKTIAAGLHGALVQGKAELLKEGDWFSIKNNLISRFFNTEKIQLEYLELVQTDRFTIEEKLTADENFALCIAAYVEEVRLIDNILINKGELII